MPSIHIIDGSLMVSDGITHITTSLTLNDILFVPKFLISLIYINNTNEHNNCSVILFSTYHFLGHPN